jgi:DNA-binding transcriptional regulator YhcF (GntR family)
MNLFDQYELDEIDKIIAELERKIEIKHLVSLTYEELAREALEKEKAFQKYMEVKENPCKTKTQRQQEKIDQILDEFVNEYKGIHNSNKTH